MIRFGLQANCPSLAGAIEKQKLVYILNRDAAARLTISSPLEAHKANTLVYHVVGVDVGFENPMFACLEMDYEVSSLGCLLSFVLPLFVEGGERWLLRPRCFLKSSCSTAKVRILSL